jgi:hypothetical protein
MVVMAEQADLSAAAALTTKEAKGEYVFRALRETAERTQGALLNLLDTLGVSYRAYYVTNSIAVAGNRAVVNALAANPLVGCDPCRYRRPQESLRPQLPGTL